MLKKREPFQFDQNLKRTRTPWRSLLTGHEQSFLTDNQLSAFVSPQGPGCERIHFYPLPFAHRFTGGRWNYEELVNHDSLRSIGPRLELPVDQVNLTFRPDRIVKTMRAGRGRIRERCAVSGDTLAMMWNLRGVSEVPLHFALPHFAAQTELLPNGLLISIRDQVFVALSLQGADAIEWDNPESTSSFECRARIRISGNGLSLALTCGYDRDQVIEQVSAASANPAALFNAAEQQWDGYFTRVVPRFECSHKAITKLYYYQAYTTRANLYDIPYEPFTQPYTCPWKTGAVWQWSWNTPMNAIAERWLNDKHLGAGGIQLLADNGGALNIGSCLHPVRKVSELRGYNENVRRVGGYLKSMPDDVDLVPLTTIPHTMPNGLLGAWELYLCSGDRDYLRRAYELMIEAEGHFGSHALDSGLCTTSFVDEFDYSLRLKPFIKAFAKGDPEMMLKMDTPFIAIDWNCALHALRERIIQAAEILRIDDDATLTRLRDQNVLLKASINRYLWSEEDGFYYDTDPRTMQHSGIKCIGAYAALYAGIADERQAARMVGHLTNPAEFGTPYPCPSISMDTPDTDPALITYGGDCLMTSGLWFTVEGLYRYGYRDLAAQCVLKAIEMVNKEGPSSSYSYHTLTGRYNQGKHTLAAQCTILTDLICRHVIGLRPVADGDPGLDPVALEASALSWLRFGPYRYRGSEVVVTWERESNPHGPKLQIRSV